MSLVEMKLTDLQKNEGDREGGGGLGSDSPARHGKINRLDKWFHLSSKNWAAFP